MRNKITAVKLRTVLDSTGRKTVEAEVVTDFGRGIAASPRGTSTGKHEAVFAPRPIEELVSQAERGLVPRLLTLESQAEVDTEIEEYDGTGNFSFVGGAVSTAVSMAAAKAFASAFGMPLYQTLALTNTLPFLLSKVIGGGMHAHNGCDVQEILVLGKGRSVRECAEINRTVHERIGNILRTGTDLEGGWVAPLTCEEALGLVTDVITEAGLRASVGIDVAGSTIYRRGAYFYKREGRKRDSGEQAEFIKSLVKNYKLVYVEDPFHEEDFENHRQLTKALGKRVFVCGDDLYATNLKRVEENPKATNTVLIKPNQAGTLTRMFNAITAAQNNGQGIVLSHRSAETNDASIAHYAVAFDAKMIKIGIVGGERTAKINELIRIEEQMEKPRMIALKK